MRRTLMAIVHVSVLHSILTDNETVYPDFLLKAVNDSFDPCDNFYMYSCGGLISSMEVPAHKSTYAAVHILIEKVNVQVRDSLLKSIDKAEARGKQLAKMYYNTCTNLELREKIGASQLIDKLNKFDFAWPMAMKDAHVPEDLDLDEFYHKSVVLFPIKGLLSTYIYPDASNPTRNIIKFKETWITLTRDMYLNETKFAEHQAHLKIFITKLATLVAQDMNNQTPNDLDLQVEQLFKFEREIAKISPSLSEQRSNSEPIVNVMKIKDVQRLIPEINLLRVINDTYGSTTTFPLFTDDLEVNVANVDFMERFACLLRTTSKRTIVNFIIWQSIDTSDLSDKYTQLAQGSGTTPREERSWWCVRKIQRKFKDAVDALYIESYVKPTVKGYVANMTKNLKAAFSGMIKKLDWMDNETIEAAQLKLHTMKEHLGYADYLLDDQKLDEKYTALDIKSNDSLYMMNDAIRKWELQTLGQWLLKPVDLSKFNMAVTDVNAVYSRQGHQYTAHLQDPYFDPDFPIEVNLGAIGAIIGHEISHGFDDSGMRFDHNGKLNNWWTNYSRTHFDEHAECFVDQFSNFTVPELNMHGNGRLGLDENIADFSGARIAYETFKLYYEAGHIRNKKRSLKMFFRSLSYWACGKERLERTARNLLRSSHAPYIFRINGPLSNMQAFADAFNCEPGSNMNPINKCSLW